MCVSLSQTDSQTVSPSVCPEARPCFSTYEMLQVTSLSQTSLAIYDKVTASVFLHCVEEFVD